MLRYSAGRNRNTVTSQFSSHLWPPVVFSSNNPNISLLCVFSEKKCGVKLYFIDF